MKLLWRACSFLAVGLVAATETDSHAAPTKSECITAFDRGQRAVSDRKLRQARTELLVCSQESCPAVLRADCSGVLQSVQSSLPTVVFAADDGAGHDVSDVQVYVGAEEVASSIDGRAIELDPGTYDVRFETAGADPVTVHLVVKEGEKSRPVRAAFPSLAPKPLTVPVVEPKRRSASEPRSVAGWTVPIGLGAVGGLALGFAGISRLRFDGDVDDMRSRCAPTCTQAERADLSSTLVAANVSLGIGIGMLAGAVVSWFLLQPTERRTSDAPATSRGGTIGRLLAGGAW